MKYILCTLLLAFSLTSHAQTLTFQNICDSISINRTFIHVEGHKLKYWKSKLMVCETEIPHIRYTWFFWQDHIIYVKTVVCGYNGVYIDLTDDQTKKLYALFKLKYHE